MMGFIQLIMLCVNKTFSEQENAVYHVSFHMGNLLSLILFPWPSFASMFFFVSLSRD